MAEIEAEVKRWGNSLGVRLPRDMLNVEGISEGDRVHLTVEKSVAPNPALWGMLKNYPKRKNINYAEFRAEERRKERARDRRLGLR